MDTKKYNDKERIAAQRTGMYRKGLHLDDSDKYNHAYVFGARLLVILGIKLYPRRDDN
jgi:hypothetical protein